VAQVRFPLSAIVLVSLEKRNIPCSDPYSLPLWGLGTNPGEQVGVLAKSQEQEGNESLGCQANTTKCPEPDSWRDDFKVVIAVGYLYIRFNAVSPLTWNDMEYSV
jgi:hypothetical protein